VDSPHVDHWQKGRERIEAEDLLAYVVGEDPDPDDEIPSGTRRRFDRLLARRATGEPLAHILGYVDFKGLRLRVKPAVFVPRDSSELLATEAIRRLARRRRPVAVDPATGAGPVALAIGKAVRGARVFGTDLSSEAVSLARDNAKRLRIRATFVRGDLFRPLPEELAGRVDVITFHPPYLGRGELRDLPDEIRRFEPAMALTDRSPKGMRLIDRAADEGREWLRPGGWLLVEVAPDRGRSVAALLRRYGFKNIRIAKEGLEVSRVVAGRL
jgi:release factor glutamine methyltransferase